MVCLRCKMMVKQELEKMGLHFITVELGDVDIQEDISESQRAQLKIALLKIGLELMDDKKAILIEKIKNVIIKTIHDTDEVPKLNFSSFLSEELGYNYTYLANHFSESTGVTIEQFLIMHKIERVKELIIYDELNLTEIAYKLHYSSVAHLSNQFKKVTGLTPTFFKALKEKKKEVLNDV